MTFSSLGQRRSPRSSMLLLHLVLHVAYVVKLSSRTNSRICLAPLLPIPDS